MKPTFKDYLKTLIGLIFVFSPIYFFINLSEYNLNEKIKNLEDKIETLEKRIETLETISPDSIFNKDWFIFKLALAKVESNLNPNAVNNKTKAGGLFQIMPNGGFLQEANRIIGYAEYSDTCRFNVERSNEIFEIINNKKNPLKDFDVALKLHNPRAGERYKERVMKEYNFFKKLSMSNKIAMGEF